jgi:hypothetical protein
LIRAQVTILRRPEGTFLHLTAGGFTPSTRISNSLLVVKRVRRPLRSASKLTSSSAPGQGKGCSGGQSFQERDTWHGLHLGGRVTGSLGGRWTLGVGRRECLCVVLTVSGQG